ncbi:hypothetical protein, partial [Escherichia coli]|uniref:hypothetical protein n=1 Tax=Escherichia coli TaxID=562 RepID=UPI001379F78D
DPFSRALTRELEKRVLVGIPADSMHPGEKGKELINNTVPGYLFEYGHSLALSNAQSAVV